MNGKSPIALTRRSFGAGLAALAAARGADAGAPPLVAAASDLRYAVEELADAFREETGASVRLAFGSTGNFTTQIRSGAPYEMFMAADESYIDALHREGLTRDGGALYALGRVALVAPRGGALRPDPAMDGLAAMLEAGAVNRFAIANPEHAPYGARAEEALRHRGLWRALAPHLVLGENVGQAAQFALSGDAAGGIIAQSLALAPPIRARCEAALIPADWHRPLRQRMALLKGAGPVAEAFFEHVRSPGARAVMARYGFALPA